MNPKPMLPVLAIAALLSGAAASGASAPDPDQARVHLERARAAAGSDHAFIFGQLCQQPIQALGAPPPVGEVPAALSTIDQARTWYAEPVQVFDDLYFLGQTAFSVWALRTSEGIILIDAIFDYSVEDEVIGGLRKLGVDPKEIRYLIISHAHADHSGGPRGGGGLRPGHAAGGAEHPLDGRRRRGGRHRRRVRRTHRSHRAGPVRTGHP
jgi:metallo-beta-lactamase class B